MHPETHLWLHHVRSIELRSQAQELLIIPHTPRTDLRTRLGWTLVELGLHLLPNRPTAPPTSPRTA